MFASPPFKPFLDEADTRIGDLRESTKVGLAGVPWDWSTAGDPSARRAPEEIRSALYRLPTLSGVLGPVECRPRDWGDVIVEPCDWRATRERIREAARVLYENNRFSLFIGGDHSITGETVASLIESTGGCVGLLMLDSHFDLRTPRGGITSGRWLGDLYSEYGPGRIATLILGIGEYTNPAYLAVRAEELGIRYLAALEVYHDIDRVYDEIDRLAVMDCDAYYITVDMDHISEAYAPGVNSPSPIGLEPQHTLAILAYAMTTLRPVAADITEVVPAKDPSGRTVRLAARIAEFMLHLGCRI